MSVTAITSTEQFDQVLRAHDRVVVDFHAQWCGPCKKIAPEVEALAKNCKTTVKFVKVDVDDLDEVAGRYGVNSMPTFLFFHKGNIERSLTIVGANPRAIETNTNTLISKK